MPDIIHNNTVNMNIELNIRNLKFNIENVYVEDYIKKYEKNRELFSEHFVDFSEINGLKGNKDILEQTFQDTKKELLIGCGSNHIKKMAVDGTQVFDNLTTLDYNLGIVQRFVFQF